MTEPSHPSLHDTLARTRGLKGLARELVRDEHLAEDLLQDAMVAALAAPAGGVRRPESWLRSVVHKLALFRRRSNARRDRRERASARPEALHGPDELVAQQESTRLLLAEVLALEPHEREVVLLHYIHEISVADIAARLESPEPTIRTRLRRALLELRRRLDQHHGGERRAWALALAAWSHDGTNAGAEPKLATSARASSPPAVSLSGALAGGAFVVALVAVLAWRQVGAHADSRGSDDDASTSAHAVALATTRDANVGTPIGSERIPLRSSRASDETRDAHAVVPAAGDTSGQMHVDGLVLDPSGRPVAGARVWRTAWDRWAEESDWEAPLAITGDDGRFSWSGEAGYESFYARAAGYAPSATRSCTEEAGSTVGVVLVLAGGGGVVEGIVVGPDRSPVPGAQIVFRTRGQLYVATERGDRERLQDTFLHRCSDSGRFRAEGLPIGRLSVGVRGNGMAAWERSVEVTSAPSEPLQFELAPTATVHGWVRTSAGERPILSSVRLLEAELWFPDAEVSSLIEDGCYSLDQLPPGELALVADGGDDGTASTVLFAPPGASIEWNPVLQRGNAIHGSVVDQDGNPVHDCLVRFLAPRTSKEMPPAHDSWTDPFDGTFTIPGCPDTGGLLAALPDLGLYPVAWLEGVRPGGPPIVLRVDRASLPSARIRGRVCHGDGAAAAEATVGTRHVYPFEWPYVTTQEVEGPRGDFEIGPLPPGEWRLLIQAPGDSTMREATSVVLNAGETVDLGDLVVPRPGMLEASVPLDWNSEPAGLAFLVHARSEDSRKMPPLRFEVELPSPLLLRPGEWELEVIRPGRAPLRSPFRVESGLTTTLDLATLR